MYCVITSLNGGCGVAVLWYGEMQERIFPYNRHLPIHVSLSVPFYPFEMFQILKNFDF